MPGTVSGAQQTSQNNDAAPEVVAEPIAPFLPPARLTDQDIALFLTNPKALLTDYSLGGMAMSSRVRSLAGSSTAAMKAIIALVGDPLVTVSPQQIAAIGSGLGRAARSSVATSPDYAAFVQQKVAELNNEALTTAFLAANSEVETAALGGATAGPGGAGAGIGAGGTSSGGTGGLGDGSAFVSTTSGTFGVPSGGRYFASTSGGSSSDVSVSATTP